MQWTNKIFSFLKLYPRCTYYNIYKKKCFVKYVHCKIIDKGYSFVFESDTKPVIEMTAETKIIWSYEIIPNCKRKIIYMDKQEKYFIVVSALIICIILFSLLIYNI
jgi:hypothetical protein